jgi:MFS family permease
MISLGCIAAYLIVPALQGRIRKTTVLVASAVLVALSFFTLGAPLSYIGMIGACIVLGIGFGWMDTYCNSTMVDLHARDSASQLGLLHGGFGVGSLISPLVITGLLAVVTWQQISLLMGGLTLLIGLVFIVILAIFFRGEQTATRENILSAATLKAYLLKKRSIFILLAGFMYAATQAGLTVWLVRYMTLRYDAEALGSTALSIYWICATASRFLAPRIRLRPLKLFLIGVLTSCAFQLVGVLSGNAFIMCVMVGAIGLVTGFCIPMLVSENAIGQAGNTSLTTSALFVTMCLARILIPIFMGLVSDGISVSIAMLTPALSGALAGAFAVFALRTDTASPSGQQV